MAQTSLRFFRSLGLSLTLLLGMGACDELVAQVEIQGEVRLTRRGRAVRADLTTALVFFEPSEDPTSGVVKEESPPPVLEMLTRDKDFVPSVLAVPVGTTVHFPNADPILHNVFSVSGENSFDLGLYSKGPGKSATFKEPGLVRVFCNVHQDMVAHIRVVDTTYIVSPDSKGRFRLTVPSAEGTLTIWHQRTDESTVELKSGDENLGVVELNASRPRVPKHLNKSGKKYRRQGRRGYR